MPEQPGDPRHYDMKIPPEPDEATLKKEESKKPANDPNRARRIRQETQVLSTATARDGTRPSGKSRPACAIPFA